MKLVDVNLTLNNERKKQLRQDDKYIHVMKYMGSKRELLPDIRHAVENMVQKGATILDIFAGTASVGAYLKEDYNIFSNDIQTYSRTIAQALIESSSIELPKNIDDLISQLDQSYIKNKTKLVNQLKNTYNRSVQFAAKTDWNDKERIEYLTFFQEFPAPDNKFKTSNEELQWLTEEYLKQNKKIKKTFPYLQTTFLFSETYFSLEQAIDIDSLRYAIDDKIQDEILKSIFLAALIYAYSYCSSGTGHFAMFRDLTTVNAIRDTFIYRQRSVVQFFKNKLFELLQYHTYLPERNFKVFSSDYAQLLNYEDIKNVDLIYADPPYSFVHYSRFYHAIESLIKYDLSLIHI